MQRHSRMNHSGIDADAFSSGHPGELDIVLKCKTSDFVSQNHGTILPKAVQLCCRLSLDWMWSCTALTGRNIPHLSEVANFPANHCQTSLRITSGEGSA